MHLTFNKSVFVGGGGTCQNSELGPDLINPLLLNLEHKRTCRHKIRTNCKSQEPDCLFHFMMVYLRSLVAHLSFLISDSSVKLFALQAQKVISRLNDATLDSNSTCCVDIVTGDHTHSDARPLTLPNGLGDLEK